MHWTVWVSSVAAALPSTSIPCRTTDCLLTTRLLLRPNLLPHRQVRSDARHQQLRPTSLHLLRTDHRDCFELSTTQFVMAHRRQNDRQRPPGRRGTNDVIRECCISPVMSCLYPMECASSSTSNKRYLTQPFHYCLTWIGLLVTQLAA